MINKETITWQRAWPASDANIINSHISLETDASFRLEHNSPFSTIVTSRRQEVDFRSFPHVTLLAAFLPAQGIYGSVIASVDAEGTHVGPIHMVEEAETGSSGGIQFKRRHQRGLRADGTVRGVCVHEVA